MESRILAPFSGFAVAQPQTQQHILADGQQEAFLRVEIKVIKEGNPYNAMGIVNRRGGTCPNNTSAKQYHSLQ